MTESAPAAPRVLQFCHGYDGPFLDCARQYASLFDGTPYRVTTVYLTGKADDAVREASASDEVIFLAYSSAEIRGLKIGAIRALRRIVAEHDYALVIAHRFKPAYIARLATCLPVIGVHHAFGDYRRVSRKWFAWAYRARLRLLGVSDAVRDDLRASLGWPRERIETLYNRMDFAAVQKEQLPRHAACAALGLPREAWIVGNVGRLHPDKDQATLIRAFAHALPHLPAGSLLVILGSGREEAALKALARELAIAPSVRFLGQIPDARRYFRAFDVFALSSDHEPFGMVLLEAMAADVPVVCSDCGGGREVVMKVVGSLFPLGDAGALAQCLVERAMNADARLPDEIIRQRLEAHFSFAAGRAAFWRLPMCSNFLPGWQGASLPTTPTP